MDTVRSRGIITFPMTPHFYELTGIWLDKLFQFKRSNLRLHPAYKFVGDGYKMVSKQNNMGNATSYKAALETKENVFLSLVM